MSEELPGDRVEEDDRTLRIRLHLDRLEDLFEVPATTPWSPAYRPWMRTSASDFVIGAIYAHPRCRALSVTFSVPRELWTEDLTERTNAAVSRAAEAWQVESRHATKRTEFVALRVLAWSVVVMVAALSFNVWTADEENTIVRVIGDSVGVLGWLAIWYPLDLLVFDRLDRKVDRRARRALDAAEIRVVPTP